MAEIASTTFSQTDASNTGPLPGLTGATNPNQIDNSIQAMMGAVKREHDWRNLFLTSGGSSNAYTLTYTVAPASYYTGQVFSFTANFGCTGSATLNVNGLGAKTIKKDVAGTMTALSSGDIASGAKVIVSYDGTDFIWTNWQGVAGATYTVNGLTEQTSVDTADMLGGYDASGAVERKFSVNNVFKAVNTFTAETAVAIDDVLPLYDTSASAADKATVSEIFKAVNGLTEDTSPDLSADFILSYDTSASEAKKVKPSNFGSGAVYLAQLTVIGTSNTDITGLATTYSTFLLDFSLLSTSGSNLRVALSSNNGSSYGSDRFVSGVSTSLGLAFGSATISNVKNNGSDKVITPASVVSNDSDAAAVISWYTTAATETVVTGLINALRFNHSAVNSVSAVRVWGIP
jgi:hypothetical protein